MSVRLSGLARREYWLLVVLLTCAAFAWYGNAFEARLSQPAYLVGILAWLFVAILGSALSVVRHADRLAVRLGEPYGTLILTLSVVVIEVASITAIMLHGENNPTLTRDTLFAVVMIILNGMVGLALLLGGLRYREQHYNLQGANAYLGVILPLIAFSLLLPDFTQTTPGPTLSIGQSTFIAIVAVGLYATFLALQTGRHRNYFTFEDGDLLEEPEERATAGILPHVLLLIAYMMPVVYLAGQLAPPADYVIETMGAPDAVGGVAIAILVATPEAIGAVRAALANRVQRSINIFLGSVPVHDRRDDPGDDRHQLPHRPPADPGRGAHGRVAADRDARRLDRHLRQRPRERHAGLRPSHPVRGVYPADVPGVRAAS